MIPHDVKDAGGSHLDDVRMERPSRQAGAWHGERRTQERRVPNPRAASVPRDLIPVDLQSLVQAEEVRTHCLLGELLEGLP